MEVHAAAVSALESWLAGPGTEDSFPYDEVLTCFHRVGKHFVPAPVLDALDKARTARPADQLARFLDTLLDKRDGRYDYQTYLALAMLPMDRPRRLRTHLLADMVAFELATLDGTTTFLPDRRPDERTVTKRFRHALSVIAPGQRPAGAPRAAATQLLELVAEDQTAAERQALRLSILPVATDHDEYMFLRVLQSFEATFAFMAASLSAAVDSVSTADGTAAVTAVGEAERALRESAPLFSLLATMQVASFRSFREYTEGASAIQSRGYKTVEALCRTPDRARVDSAAYTSVPDVRAAVLAGQPNLDAAVAAAGDRLDAATRAALTAAMRGFADVLTRWRNTHHKLAVRMLGERTGTGYTLGTPYLAQVRDIPVFQCPGTGQLRAKA
jgi:tryptophan 2,3-dioxygenase